MSVIAHTLTIVNDLLDGREHDRHSIAERIGVELAAADRYIRKFMKMKIHGVKIMRRGRLPVLKFVGRPAGQEIGNDDGLLPCPHCGSEAAIMTVHGWYGVRCKKCPAQMLRRPTKSVVRKAWNRRWLPPERMF
jgi:hypothetical protein